MDNFQEATVSYTNFITPPDFVDEQKHTVVLIDATEDTIQELANFCAASSTEFNVYIYNYTMHNPEWLKEAIDRASAIIINTDDTVLSPVKDRLAELAKSWHYGHKNFLTNTNRLESPINYFQESVTEVK